MKTNFFSSAIGLFILTAIPPLPGLAQSAKSDVNACLDIKFENTCYASIKSALNDYVYLKSRSFSSDMNTEANFSILLKKNVQYVFNLCSNSQNKNPAELKLYNENNKLLATSTGDKIAFQPEKAGKYYVITILDKNSNNCCLILCGMLNKYIPPVKSKTKAK